MREDRQILIGPNALELTTSEMKIHKASTNFLQVQFPESDYDTGPRNHSHVEKASLSGTPPHPVWHL